MFSDDKSKFYVLHFSVWEDLWPYSNAYVRPGTRAKFFICSLASECSGESKGVRPFSPIFFHFHAVYAKNSLAPPSRNPGSATGMRNGTGNVLSPSPRALWNGRYDVLSCITHRNKVNYSAATEWLLSIRSEQRLWISGDFVHRRCEAVQSWISRCYCWQKR